MMRHLHCFDQPLHLSFGVCSQLISWKVIGGGQRWYGRWQLSFIGECIASHSQLRLGRRVLNAHHVRKVLQLWKELSREHRHACEFWVCRERKFVIDELKNAKAILSIEFSTFDQGPNRQHAYSPVFRGEFGGGVAGNESFSGCARKV